MTASGHLNDAGERAIDRLTPAPPVGLEPPQSLRRHFLGIDFDAVSLDQAASLIAARPIEVAFAYIVTPNVDHMVRLAGEGRDLLPIYEAAWLRLCDSRILRLLGYCRGFALSVVAGSDLVARLFDRVIRPCDAITIIGCAEPAMRALRDAYGLMHVAHYNPPLNFIASPDEVEACVSFVVAHKSRYVMLAVGSPQQEILAAQIAASRRAIGTGLCVGASLNFLTGIETRAPRWMQICCLEWLHRLVADPRRLWWRYLVRGPRIFSLFLQSEGVGRSPP